MSMQWISDRVGWNLSSTRKVWSYVFNTTQEDLRISKVLSGWKADEEVALDRLDMLDAEVETRVRVLQSLLFNICMGTQDHRLNMCPDILDTCTSRLLRSLPQLRASNPSSPVVARIDACAAQAGIRRDEPLRWAVALQGCADTKQGSAETKPTCNNCKPDTSARESDEENKALIRELIATNRLMVDRLEAVEAKLSPPEARAVPPTPRLSATVEIQPRPPSAIWFEWFAGEPRLWNVPDVKKRSEARNLVAFMKLFLPDGFRLDPSGATYRDTVLELGMAADRSLDF